MTDEEQVKRSQTALAHLALADVLSALLLIQNDQPAYRVLPRVRRASDRLHDLCSRLAEQTPYT